LQIVTPTSSLVVLCHPTTSTTTTNTFNDIYNTHIPLTTMSSRSSLASNRDEIMFLGQECHHAHCHLNDFLPFSVSQVKPSQLEMAQLIINAEL
jgi:hypothetical protein